MPAKSKTGTAAVKERTNAMGLLERFIDPKMIDEWQPSGHMAVYTTSVTIWLLVYQRLHSNASLESAFAEFRRRR